MNFFLNEAIKDPFTRPDELKGYLAFASFREIFNIHVMNLSLADLYALISVQTFMNTSCKISDDSRSSETIL